MAEVALTRLSGREIAEALEKLPVGERPENCSVPTIARDLKALREEWAAAGRAAAEELTDEEVARLNELERVWWSRALAADKEATGRVLAIRRRRAQFLRIGLGGGGGLSVTAAAAAGANGASCPVGALNIRVELVDDWRDAHGVPVDG